jgi:anaerobic magnesium-protoporphyrin IX monomethyl ester cyclase
MADILFTHSYFLRFDPKQWRMQQPFAPLATITAAAHMRENGHSVALFDTMFAERADELKPKLVQHKPRFLVVYDDGFNYLTKMCLTNMREAAFEMFQMAKQNGCKVLVSSSDATDHSLEYLQKGADFVMVGEGEQTLLALVESINSGNEDMSQMAGLRYLKDGEMVSTKPRLNLKELDQIPLPAWDLVNVEDYKQRWVGSKGYFSINLSTTRGCPFKCNWCAKPIYGNRYNARSPENVVEELKLLKARYQFDHVWFCDDIFGLKPGWVSRFADLVQEAGLDFKFKIQSRADLLLEENNIADLARAGADEIWIGAESGSQKVLDAMDKGTSVAQIVEATRLMKKHKIKPCYFLQFGYPGEEFVDIQKTFELVFKQMPYDIGVSVSYPLPGTKFYENVKSELGSKSNWTDSDELLVMFDSAYPPEFYKKLQRYVHYEFRKLALAEKLKKGQGGIDGLISLAKLVYRIPLSVWSKQQLNKYVG